MNTAQLNEAWGRNLIDSLAAQKITYFCLSPGSRCTPLVLAMTAHPNVKITVHYDERGAAFHALGYAKAAKQPAALVLTSGTAVGNALPAVMEAWAANIPLVILSCDRPASLRDTMANQTCDQIKIFGDYVRYFFDLPLPSSSHPENFLTTTIAQATTRSLYPIPGPIQINCPFEEPFFSNSPPFEFSIAKQTSYEFPNLTLQNPEKWAKTLQGFEKGVIILGANAHVPNAILLSEKLGWPILADIQSNLRSRANSSMITHFHHILNSLPNLAADVAIYFGDPCVSKILLGWMKNCSKIIHVAEHPKRYDPFHMITDRVICSPFAFINEILEFIPQKENSWLPYWRHLSHEVEKHLSIPTYSEPGLIQWLAQTPDSDSAYFFGNGMPIRDADMFFFPETLCGPIFGNRGLSGIDGNIATISGIAQNLPVTAVLGDQAVLHDLNSLALLKKTNYPVRLFIINNGGGGIFSLLPIQEKAEVLDRYFAAAHDKRFGDSARMFDLSYTLAKDASDFEKESDIIEILTSRTENASLHKKIDEEVKCAFSSMVS